MNVATGVLDRALGHWQEVFGLAFQLTGDRSSAEDLCQETYLRLARTPGPLDESGSLRPLLFTVLRNLVRNASRRPRPLALASEGSEDIDASTKAQQREERAILRDALDELPPDWRAALYLRDGLGLSYREIGHALGLGDTTVRNTLHRARIRITETVRRRTKGQTP